MFMTPEELFQEGVYVSFSSPGNSFYEDSNDGLLKPRITNAPEQESGTTWGVPYNNVKVQYNYGYQKYLR